MATFEPTGYEADVDAITQAMEASMDPVELFTPLAGVLAAGALVGDISVERPEELDPKVRQAMVDRRKVDCERVKHTSIKRMRIALLKALRSGVSPGDTPGIILDTLRNQMDILKRSAEEIGPQLGNLTYSEARAKALAQTNPTHKTWITRDDKRGRPTHAALHRMEVEWSADFPNGLSYPLDPAGPSSEVVGCRCKLVARTQEEA